MIPIFIPFHLLRILTKCEAVKETVRRDENSLHFSSMKTNMEAYLRIEKYSTVSNANRKDDFCYNKFRNIKTELRKTIRIAWYPDYHAACSYVKPVTYTEKMKSIFTGNIKPEKDQLFYAFLLLDNIFSATDIDVFILILQTSYMGKHKEQSEARQLDHSKLWDSQPIWENWNKMVFFLINLLKEPDTYHSLSDVHQGDVKTLDFVKQKINNTCQQYALYITLTIVDEIGLFPEIPGAKWKAVGDRITYEDYNVFAFILSLFQLGVDRMKNPPSKSPKNQNDFIASEDDSLSADEVTTPLQYFFGKVLSEYLVPMYNLQTQREKAGECEEADKVNTATTNTSIDDASTSASSIEDVYDDHRFPVTRIPLTYKDFCKNGYNVKVVDCFNKLKSMALKHNKKFHAKLLSEQEGLKLKKKSATKTKKSQSKTVEDGKTAKSAAEKGGTTGAKTVNTTDNRKSSKETASEELSLEKGNEEKRGATTTTSAPPIVVITQNPSAMVPLDHEGNVDLEYSGATMPSQNLPKSSFLQWLLHRQLIEEPSTNIVDLDNYLCTPGESPIIGCYVGFIFTEDLVSKMSLSTLLDIMILRQFQKCGHKPLILVRDANDAKCTAVRSVLENFLTIEENFSVASTDASLVNLPNDDLTKISRVKVLDIFQFLSKQNYATSLTIEEFNVMVRAAERVMKLNLLRSLTILFGMQDDKTIPFAVACGLNCNEKLYQVARKPIEGDTGSLNVDDKSGVAYWQFWKGASDNDLWNYLAHYTDISN